MNISNRWKNETAVSTAVKCLLQRDGRTASPLALRSVGEQQRAPAVIAGCQLHALLVERVDEVIELQAISVGVAFEEEGQSGLGVETVVAGDGDTRRCVIVGAHHTLRAEDLDALVVTETATTA